MNIGDIYTHKQWGGLWRYTEALDGHIQLQNLSTNRVRTLNTELFNRWFELRPRTFNS